MNAGRISRGTLTLALLATTGLSGCGLPFQARPAAFSPDRLYDIARPAMALVQVDYKATLTVPKLAVAKDKEKQIVDILIQQARSGKLNVNDNAAINTAYDRELLSHPAKYFSPSATETVTHDEHFQVMGSGFVASRDGYIATSAHVVATPEVEIKKEFSSGLIDSMKDPSTQAAVAKTEKIPEDLVAGYTAFLAQWMTDRLTVTNLTKEIHVAIGKGTPGLPLETNGMVATVASAGDPVPGKDVAVLKVEGKKTDFATLPIGSEKDLTAGDTITVVGYPGETILKNQDTNPREVSPSQSHGLLDGEHRAQTGYSALGSGADASPGESGGPVLDRTGRVVGITAYIMLDKDGQPVKQHSFAVPASVLREYLAKAKVRAQVSDTTTTYEAGLAEFSQQHYRNALVDFQQVKRDWPAHPYVQQFINDSEHAMVEGRDKSGPTSAQWAAIGGGAVALLLLLGGLTWLVLRRRRRRAGRLLESTPVAVEPVLVERAPARAPRPRRAPAMAAVVEPDSLTVVARVPAVRRKPAAARPAPVAPKPRTRKVPAVAATTAKVAAKKTAAATRVAAKKTPAATRAAAKATPAETKAPMARKAPSVAKARAIPAAVVTTAPVKARTAPARKPAAAPRKKAA